MAKSAGAGELRTKIIIEAKTGGRTSNGYSGEEWANVFPDGRAVFCKWVNAYGSDVIEVRRAGLEEYATLTMRYTARLAPDCRITRAGERRPYEVISINDVEDRHVWLEVKVHRRGKAI